MSMFGAASVAKIENSYQFETKTDFSCQGEKKKSYDGCLQNGEITQFYFKKLQEQEIALSLIIIINLYLVVFSTNLSYPVLRQQNLSTLKFCLYFTIICAGVAMVLVVMRTMTSLRLEKEQKLLYEKTTLITSKKILNILVEWLILILQPYPFFINFTITTPNSYHKYDMEFHVNDFLAILSFGRIYILIRTALLLTPYMNNRANRLCKMYGCRADFSYSLKCMFKDHPLKLICLFYFISVAIFAYLIYLAERQAINDPDSNFASSTTNYQNALWLILITTTTVGYGDYYPQTPIGRFIILFVAIWGTLIVSIMVVVVSNTLSMEKTQLRTSKILNKLDLREKLEDKAGKLIGYLLLSFSKRKSENRRQNVRKLLKAKNQFAEVRKAIKEMAEVNDLEDEIAAHFLKLNGDIQTLNQNQDKIIDYIHKNFNASPKDPLQNSSPQQQSESQEDEENQPTSFLQIFKTQLKQKIN